MPPADRHRGRCRTSIRSPVSASVRTVAYRCRRLRAKSSTPSTRGTCSGGSGSRISRRSAVDLEIVTARTADSRDPAGQRLNHRAQLVGEPIRPTLVALKQPGNLLPERLPRTFPRWAEQTPDLQRHHHRPPVDRDIPDRPAAGLAVHPTGRHPTCRARHRFGARSGHHLDVVALVFYALDDQGRRANTTSVRSSISARHSLAGITQRHHRLRARAPEVTTSRPPLSVTTEGGPEPKPGHTRARRTWPNPLPVAALAAAVPDRHYPRGGPTRQWAGASAVLLRRARRKPLPGVAVISK